MPSQMHRRTPRFASVVVAPGLLAGLWLVFSAAALEAQVHYFDDDTPWGQRARSGPDAEVPGWFYNLGLTGIRAQLIEREPKALRVRYVFPDSPAAGLVQPEDVIVGTGEALFVNPHRNGYGESVFGADGPVLELADALEHCQGPDGDGQLVLLVRRGSAVQSVPLTIGRKYGAFSKTFPSDCPKSDRIRAELLEYLVQQQGDDGSFGDAVHNTFAPLALLGSGDARYREAVARNVQFHCRETRPDDRRYGSLMNWTYMSAAIVVSEQYLATGDESLLPELEEIYQHLRKAQYLHPSQINPKARESHPDSFPKGPRDSHGGWGHNPGFEGYGPIQMLTAQGALAYSLLSRCGIDVDESQHAAAQDFIWRGTAQNGYVWYGDELGGGPDNWADMGRTGAAALASMLSPFQSELYRERALTHARVIGLHPQSFPDTHGSPPMGMAYAALGAHVDANSFRRLMDANRWWFTMAQCQDGTFYYQPNRDNAGYGDDARLTASSVVALILTIPQRSLVITGKELR